MEGKLSVLMVAAEVHPFAKVGGLADVMGALPRALADAGHDVKIALPYYKKIKDGDFKVGPVKAAGEFDIPMGDVTVTAGARSTKLPDSRVEVLLIESDRYFGRDGVYSNAATGEGFSDNAERFIFFSKAALRLARIMDYRPDIVHCHDHQTGFIPAWLRDRPDSETFFKQTGIVYTIHNLAYQGVFPRKTGYIAGFSEHMMKPMGGIEFHDKVNMMKAGIIYSDTITTVSPTYAEEIQTPEFGYGLEGVLKSRARDLVGILNGADYSVWNPETDRLIPYRYSTRDLTGKRLCRNHLSERLGLKVADGVPLVGMISRLVDQKGFDLVAEAFDRLLELDIGVVILGTGDKKYHDLLSSRAERYPDRVSVNIAFDEELAHLIEAGSDMFLMPSKYEPCGLNQMYSMKYGTVPVVRKTGGLADSVMDFDASPDSTGFAFDDYSSKALLDAVRRAREVFRDGKAWNELVLRAMKRDFSWKQQAKEYAGTYAATLKKRKVVT
ncbi:MAG: glycogen synthase GlgA [bacterium]|jgi:starch synthase